MTNLEVVLRGFAGWANEQNDSIVLQVGTDDSGDLILPFSASAPFHIGVGISNGELQLLAASADDPDVQLIMGIGAKFKSPQLLGIEIAKHLLSFAQEARRIEEPKFERALIEVSAEVALTVRSHLYAGLALTTLGLFFKEDDDPFIGFVLTSAAVKLLFISDNDDMLAMGIKAREACWEEYLRSDFALVSQFRAPMRDEFLKLASGYSPQELAHATGNYIRTIAPLLYGETSGVEGVDAWSLSIEYDSTELVRGVIMDDFVWKLAEKDISGIEVDWHFHSGLISDSFDPDEAAFVFLLNLISWNNKYQLSGDGFDKDTQYAISSIYDIEAPLLIHSMSFVATSEAILGTVLIGLLQIVDGWEKIPNWLDEDALSEAINSYAERYETSYFLEEIFELATSSRYGYSPRS